jgi:hypothetical protein
VRGKFSFYFSSLHKHTDVIHLNIQVGIKSEIISYNKNIVLWELLVSFSGWWYKIYYLELLRASEGTLSGWSRLQVVSTHQSPLSPRGGLWPVLLVIIHKEGLCRRSKDINRLMMMNCDIIALCLRIPLTSPKVTNIWEHRFLAALAGVSRRRLPMVFLMVSRRPQSQVLCGVRDKIKE